jgi:hypothetical protein
MRKFSFFVVVILFATSIAFAQTNMVKPYTMYQTELIKPKIGQEPAFEKAVMAHISKFHASDPYKARLERVDGGMGSDGWYVFIMGPTNYAAMDGQPNGNNQAHDDDWSKNISPLVEKYGETSFWKLQDDLSYTPASYAPAMLDIWSLKIKPGMRYKFEDLAKKISKVSTDKKYAMSFRVFYNDLFDQSGYNASVVFGFNKWSDLDIDVAYKADYEAAYGPGSWDNFWDDWRSCVETVDESIRTFVK